MLKMMKVIGSFEISAALSRKTTQHHNPGVTVHSFTAMKKT
jgi:hypothetical protein